MSKVTLYHSAADPFIRRHDARRGTRGGRRGEAPQHEGGRAAGNLAILAINPMGKVPGGARWRCAHHRTGARSISTSRTHPGEGPRAGDRDALRGPYLRWLVFYGSSFEPAVVDRAMKREGGSRS